MRIRVVWIFCRVVMLLGIERGGAKEDNTPAVCVERNCACLRTTISCEGGSVRFPDLARTNRRIILLRNVRITGLSCSRLPPWTLELDIRGSTLPFTSVCALETCAKLTGGIFSHDFYCGIVSSPVSIVEVRPISPQQYAGIGVGIAVGISLTSIIACFCYLRRRRSVIRIRVRWRSPHTASFRNYRVYKRDGILDLFSFPQQQQQQQEEAEEVTTGASFNQATFFDRKSESHQEYEMKPL